MDRFAAYTRHVNPALGRFLELSGRALRLVRATGAHLIDDEGRTWDDWIAGFGTLNLGHARPELVETARAHLLGGAPALYPEQLNPFAGELAARLLEASGPGFADGTVFFGHGGADAVEAAIKTALLAAELPGAGDGPRTIAFADGGFHGVSLGALSAMAPGLYRDDFDRAGVLAPFRRVPWADLEALEATLARGDVAAFLVEPIQVEAGVRIAPPGYLTAAAELCHAHGALLIVDEVQTGMGRTGRLFAWQESEGSVPDIVCAAKALGGGVVPIGAAIMRAGIWERAFGSPLRAEIHAITMGGNALAAAVGARALELTRAPALLAGVRERGRSLLAALGAATADCPSVTRVEGRGLLGGITVADPDHPSLSWEALGLPELTGYPTGGPLLVERLARRRILAHVCAHDWAVVRIEPPLVVEPDACERFVDGVLEAARWLDEHRRSPVA